MAVVCNLYPDRDGVHVAVAGPNTDARVPSTARLRDELKQPAVFKDEIMRGDLRGCRAKVFEGSLARRNPRIMQDDRVWHLPLAVAMIRRDADARGKTAVGFQ